MKKKIIFAIAIFAGLFLSFGSLSEVAFANYLTAGVCKGGWNHDQISGTWGGDQSGCLSHGACFRTNLRNGLDNSYVEMTSVSGLTSDQCVSYGTCWYTSSSRQSTDMAKLSCEGRGTPDWPSTGNVWYQNTFQQNIWVPACADVNQIDPISGVSLIDHFTVCRPTMGCTNKSAFNYNSSADIDDGSCISRVYGCTNGSALNYNSSANTNDGSCISRVYGCTNGSALNYNSSANTDNGSCRYRVYGCTKKSAINYNSLATTDDGSCRYRYCPKPSAGIALAECQSTFGVGGTCVADDSICPTQQYCSTEIGEADLCANNHPEANCVGTTDSPPCKCGPGSTDPECKKEYCGEVNNPLANNAMTEEQCKAANPGQYCWRNDDICTYNPGCDGTPYPNVDGTGYECCRPNGTAVGSPRQPCQVVGNQRCRDRNVCSNDPFSTDDPPAQMCSPSDSVCAVGIVDQCIPDRPNQCGSNGDAWCEFIFDVQYTYNSTSESAVHTGVIYSVQIDTGYWYDPNVQACVEPDIQAILDETFAPLDTPPPSAVILDGIPVTPIVDQCPNLNMPGDQSFDDYVNNGYTREANGDCGCPAGKKMDENYMCVDLTCEDIQTNADNACYDAYYSTYDYDTLVSCMSDATNAYNICAGFPSCGSAYGSTIPPGTVANGDVIPDSCSYGTASGATLNTDTNLYEWTCTAANGESSCSAYSGSCPDDTPIWCYDHCSADACEIPTTPAGNPLIRAHDGPVVLSNLKVSPPIVNPPGTCNIKWDASFDNYYTLGYSSTDPSNPDPELATHCQLSTQDGIIKTFDPGTTLDTGLSDKGADNQGIRKDTIYTLKCWDGLDENNNVQSTSASCRVNTRQGEFN